MVRNLLVISHRGANRLEPENTIPAFKTAISFGVDMLEMDVRYTKDKVPVIFHDENLKRLFGKDININELNFQEFKELRLKRKNGSEVSLPSLKEVLKELPEIMINLELKDYSEDFSFEKHVIELLKRYNRIKDIWFASKRVLVHKWLKGKGIAKTIFLQKRRTNEDVLDLINEIVPSAVQIRFQGLDSKFIAKLHSKGIKVFYFYADEEKDVINAINIGVDGILTNEPDKVIKFLVESNL